MPEICFSMHHRCPVLRAFFRLEYAMLNVKQLTEYVVRPVLNGLGAYSREAELLVLGTAAQESHLIYIHQLSGGPALGLWQMEPATHNDIVRNYLEYRPELAAKVFSVSGCAGFDANNLLKNLSYACAFSRIHYLRKPGAIPATLEGQAAYWKRHYNTSLGRGTEREYISNFHRLISPHLEG